MTIKKLIKFFAEHGIHISDGVDDCAGDDPAALKKAGLELLELMKP